MKLLVVTQAVDFKDPILGFFHRWLEKISEKTDSLYVIANRVGEYNLPNNVEVLSLGKEKDYGRLRRIFQFFSFSVLRLRKCDGIFVHMCPEYAIAIAPLAKLFRKPILLWYVHRSKNFKLKLAEKIVDKILTASRESCQIKSDKIKIVGHGIDTDFFKPKDSSRFKVHLAPSRHVGECGASNSQQFKILSVGRVSPIKDYETLINSLEILVKQNVNDLEVSIIGSPFLEADKLYFEKLKHMVESKRLNKAVHFKSSMSQTDLLYWYQNSDLLVNLCPTGGMDKVVLEAAACGLPVLICNESFENLLGQYKDLLLFKYKDAEDLALKLTNLRTNELKNLRIISQFLRGQIVEHHNLDKLADRILTFYEKN